MGIVLIVVVSGGLSLGKKRDDSLEYYFKSVRAYPAGLLY